MKRIILALLMLFYKNMGYAQCINTYSVQTTDPATVNQQTNSTNRVNDWNWTRDIFDDAFIGTKL